MTNRYVICRPTFLALGLGFMAGCAGVEFRAEPSRVTAIRTVAVVSFAVPEYVAEKEASALGSLVALGTLGKQLFKGEKVAGNGQAVAREAITGFIETMSKDGKLQFLPMNQVVDNAAFAALKDSYGSKSGQKTTLPGLPVILLDMKMPRSEFAGKAAKALGVDGVIMIYTNELNYQLYTGTLGTGQAKAFVRAMFKLFDGEGNSVWEAGSVVNSAGSGAMVAGAINPLEADALHKSIGETVASDLLKQYAKLAK